jgi:hemoglobin
MRDTPRPAPTRDLDTPQEINEMVRRFCADVAQDDMLGPVFNEVAKVDWSEHLPKLTSFWCRALLGMPGYSRNPFRARTRPRPTSLHGEAFRALAVRVPRTLELGWVGPQAQRAAALAQNVARVHRRQLGCPQGVNQRMIGALTAPSDGDPLNCDMR